MSVNVWPWLRENIRLRDNFESSHSLLWPCVHTESVCLLYRYYHLVNIIELNHIHSEHTTLLCHCCCVWITFYIAVTVMCSENFPSIQPSSSREAQRKHWRHKHNWKKMFISIGFSYLGVIVASRRAKCDLALGGSTRVGVGVFCSLTRRVPWCRICKRCVRDFYANSCNWGPWLENVGRYLLHVKHEDETSCQVWSKVIAQGGVIIGGRLYIDWGHKSAFLMYTP